MFVNFTVFCSWKPFAQLRINADISIVRQETLNLNGSARVITAILYLKYGSMGRNISSHASFDLGANQSGQGQYDFKWACKKDIDTGKGVHLRHV